MDNKLAKLRRHASQVHFAKIHFGKKTLAQQRLVMVATFLVIVAGSLVMVGPHW